ncbi:MAG: hypothetical protein LBM27_04415 [Lactobacillaceae bacterium]|jgi:uncharacterized protein YxjI|nr:hypothetical protein [Lactobacillaceae bacterium]
MTTLYLPKNRSKHIVDLDVFDEDKNPILKVTGTVGHKMDVLYVYDLNYNELARIRQTTTGLLPRFQLLHDDNYVASFSFNLGPLSDIIYISHLNWIVTGEIAAGKYRIRYGTKKLLNVSPVDLPDGTFNQLEITLDNQTSVHVAIVALLDSWSAIKNPEWINNLLKRRKPKFKMAFGRNENFSELL